MDKKQPLIGITTCPYPEYDGEKLRSDYIRRITEVGGVPLLIPSPTLAEADYPVFASTVLDALDGLLLSGGGDYAPQLCGMEGEEEPTPRDLLEMALLKEAWERRLPVLGICRGMQGMAAVLGGTLINLGPVGEGPHAQKDPRAVLTHDVTLLGELQSLYGWELWQVNSHHHQAVAKIPEGLRVGAFCTGDKIIEAIYARDRFWLGLQWHPESYGEKEPFEALLLAAKDYQQEKGKASC